jgi:HK97 family phage portal protein
MGMKSWVAGKLGIETKSTDNPYSDEAFFRDGNQGQVHAGVNVNYSTAIRHQDVYSCIRIKSESIGQLPIKLYRKNEKGHKVEITSGREFKIFTQRPNSYQTWQEFIEMYVTTMELRGNFFCEINRNKHGSVYEIIPFKQQDAVAVNMDMHGNVYYTYATNDMKSGMASRGYTHNQILHIKANSMNGYLGLSPISFTASTIGTAIAGELHTSNMLGSGAMPAGVLSTDEAFDDDEAIERVRQGWKTMHGGASNAGKTAILEYGMKYTAISMSAVDAQLIEQRMFSREQIATIFRVPIHLLNAAAGMKYNSIEHNNASFFRDSLMPLVTKLENNINPILPANHTIQVDQTQFIRGDQKAQTDNVTAKIKSGLMSINEGRIELSLTPVEGGDVFAVATNNLHFSTWDNLEAVQAAMNKGPAKSESGTPVKPDEPDPNKNKEDE